MAWNIHGCIVVPRMYVSVVFICTCVSVLFVLVFSILNLLSYVCMYPTRSFYSVYVRVGMSGKRKSKWDQPAVGSSGTTSVIPTATSKWDQTAVDSGGETSVIPTATSKWDQPAVDSGGKTSVIPTATSKWDQPAVDSGGETSGFPPATSKWDQPAVDSSHGNTKTGRWDSPSTGQKSQTIEPSGEVGSNLAAEALARINSMLATQKRQTVSEPVSHQQQLIHRTLVICIMFIFERITHFTMFLFNKSSECKTLCPLGLLQV